MFRSFGLGVCPGGNGSVTKNKIRLNPRYLTSAYWYWIQNTFHCLCVIIGLKLEFWWNLGIKKLYFEFIWTQRFSMDVWQIAVTGGSEITAHAKVSCHNFQLNLISIERPYWVEPGIYPAFLPTSDHCRENIPQTFFQRPKVGRIILW